MTAMIMEKVMWYLSLSMGSMQVYLADRNVSEKVDGFILASGV